MSEFEYDKGLDVSMVIGPGILSGVIIDPPNIPEYIKYIENGGEDALGWYQTYKERDK